VRGSAESSTSTCQTSIASISRGAADGEGGDPETVLTRRIDPSGEGESLVYEELEERLIDEDVQADALPWQPAVNASIGAPHRVRSRGRGRAVEADPAGRDIDGEHGHFTTVGRHAEAKADYGSAARPHNCHDL
jgi:hypothetical protein